MIHRIVYSVVTLSLKLSTSTISQTNPVIDIFPTGTTLYGKISYNNDTLPKHLLDIYLPSNAKGKVPLVIFIRAGGWLGNDKYADIGYMKNRYREF